MTGSLAWVPFVTAAPMWDAWQFLIIPLLVGIAVAYKATKSATPAAAALDAAKLAGYLLLGLSAAAVGLYFFVDALT